MSTVTRISGLQKCPTAVGHRHRVSVQFSRHFTRPGPDLHSNLYDIQRLLRPFTQISTRLIHYQKNSNCFVSQLPNLRIQQTRPMGAKKGSKRASTESGNSTSKKAKKNAENSENQHEAGDSAEKTEEKVYPLKEMTADGRKRNLKIVSWNVAGLRACVKKSGHDWLFQSDADIICLQEIKCSEDNAPAEIKDCDGYTKYWNPGEKAGRNGVCLLSKVKPVNVEYGVPGKPEHSSEGRTITAEYDKFYLVTSYVPNSGRGLVRLDYRQEWNTDFLNYLKNLDEKKPVILCGDLNVSHQEIDLKNPKTNKKTAGFTQQERDGFSELLKEGFVDSFRKLYPDRTGAYSFWTYMGNARAKNVGWRLDYYVLSERMQENLCDSIIADSVMGSDHCPVTLLMSLP